MLTINTNLSSLIAQSSMKQSTNSLNQAIERMSTGYKINYAKDNAANYSIATNMTTKIGAYNVAEDNTAMGLDLISTAEGALDQIQDKLQRLRALQEQASNGTYGTESLKAINSEANALVEEINRLYSTAEYNGQKLFGSAEASPAVATFAMIRAVTVDEAKRVSNVSSFRSGETYYITDSADLVALQDLVNAGKSGEGAIFELTEDIDMQGVSFRGIGKSSSYAFKGTFNGNGHVIKNLTIDTTEGQVGLFGYVIGATIDSVGVVNCNIKGSNNAGGLAGSVNSSSSISNCYSTGSVEGSGNFVGGLVGSVGSSPISNSYSTCSIKTNGDAVGGLAGSASYSASIINSYSTGSVKGNNNVGGLVGQLFERSSSTNSYSIGSVDGINRIGGFVGYVVSDGSGGSGNYYNQDAYTQAVGSGSFSGVEAKSVAEITAPTNLEAMGFTEANGWEIVNGVPRLAWESASQGGAGGSGGGAGGGATPPAYAPDTILLQVGASSDWASQVGVSTKFVLTGVDDLRMIGLDTTTDYLGQIDDMLEIVAEKQTHFGAVSNRLESVLEEITIKRDNLISSRSTIRDADIAEVSAIYIQQQILQQAAATLLATANQSPSIALQLI